MSWTEITRVANIDAISFVMQVDTTAAEWPVDIVFLADSAPCRRPREVDLRAVMDAILCRLATGCQWRALPKDFPPRSTVRCYFYLWRDLRLWWRD